MACIFLVNILKLITLCSLSIWVWHHRLVLNHHKEDCIKRNGANCIGIHLMNNSTPESRKAAESDILAANSFTCNDQEN